MTLRFKFRVGRGLALAPPRQFGQRLKDKQAGQVCYQLDLREVSNEADV
ncbi:16S rRNA (Guanine(966)-N(2))-methyltransferase [Aeromonas salmonicida]|nr:16S rRNA (Guanine(966)-N(2))-methyltransferase [Aeromonas salmonicida]